MRKFVCVLIAIMIGFAIMPHMTEAKSYSRHYSTPSRTNTYHSGYRSPSNNLTRTPGSTVNRGMPSFGRSFATHGAAFGAGLLLGHMFHPFGGFYGGQAIGFSFFGILLDFVAILVIIWLIKKVFTRRRE